ncbi:MAG: protein kinase [Planctomycetaceae bacterium]|nr:protein kinase [Planctomycetaceae bacterium]
MAGNEPDNNFAEDLSASLSRALEEMGSGFAKTGSSRPARAGRGSTLSTPTADGMEEALESPLNRVLGKADGGFLAGLLDAKGTDDPATRDYGERYQYLDVIGEGGQGKVLRFRDTVLDRDVAIKVVKPPFMAEREKLLENEARLGGMLEHPNILPTYDLCRDETGSPFFVMKKVEGVSLDELLKKAHADGAIHNARDRGEYSRRRLLNVFVQVCHAMQYAHSRGVCHLDLKPQNVKLGPFGEVYVLDWGFASRVEDSPKMVAGTPLYIAPERFKPGKPDQRCDIYSLGVMLYRILVNALPRDVGKTSFKEFRRRIQDFPIVPPRQRDPSLPRDLEAIILKALAEDPDERYQSVGALAGDLERFLDILPVTAYREGWYGRALKFARRHRATVMAASVMLLAAILTIGASIRARSLAAQTEAAELQARAAELQARLDREKTQRAIDQMREAEDARREAIARQRQADEARRLAEEERRELIRRRAAARVPLEKGTVIMDRSKLAVDKERDRAKKLQLLQPAIDFFSEALAILEGDGRENGDAAGAYYARARAYEQAKEVQKAIADYQTAYERDASYIMAHYYLGLLYYDVHRDEKKAIEQFAAMNAIDPGNEFSEIGQAYIDVHSNRDAEALERVDRIEQKERERSGGEANESWRNPGLSTIWLIRGLVYGKRGGEFFNPEKGIEAYSNYIMYEAEKPATYANRGTLHEAMYLSLRATDKAAAEKHLDAAIADYGRALAVDPSYKAALQHRGYAQFKYKENTEAALKDVEAALAIDPNYTTVLLDRAAIRETQGEYDAALKDYARVKEISPDNRNVDYRLGILYLYTNQLDKAEAAFDIAITRSVDKNTEGIRLHRRGIIRFLRGDFAGAVEDFDRSLEVRRSGQIYPALMRWLALARMGRRPSPEDFGRHVDVGPDKPWLAVVAGIYLGDVPVGDEQAMRLASTPEAVCEAGFYLGARAWTRGDNETALELLNQAIESKVTLYMEYSMAKILYGRILQAQQNARLLPDTVGGEPVVPDIDELVLPLDN